MKYYNDPVCACPEKQIFEISSKQKCFKVRQNKTYSHTHVVYMCCLHTFCRDSRVVKRYKYDQRLKKYVEKEVAYAGRQSKMVKRKRG
jgi:hypothetical protein